MKKTKVKKQTKKKLVKPVENIDIIETNDIFEIRCCEACGVEFYPTYKDQTLCTDCE